MRVKLKRAYEPAEPDDGFRILVDRLWPRGLSKASAHVDLWLKEIAPSGELRRWFAHDPKRWRAFRARYFREIDANPDVLAKLRERASKGTVTLLYAARDERYNDAVALDAYLRARQRRPKRSST
jgi:uncharacterized protein YeaO (DUF488 family)